MRAAGSRADAGRPAACAASPSGTVSWRGAARGCGRPRGGLPARRARARAVRVRVRSAGSDFVPRLRAGAASPRRCTATPRRDPAAFLHAWWHRAPEHLRGRGSTTRTSSSWGLAAPRTPTWRRAPRRAPRWTRARDRRDARAVWKQCETLRDSRLSARRAARAARDDSRCPCPMHRAFAGTLRSDVTRRVRPRQHGDGPGRGPVAGRAGLRAGGRRRRRPSRGLGKDRARHAGGVPARFARPERLCGANEGGSGGGAFECARCGDAPPPDEADVSFARAARW